jgi:eukaryotic-like serine/threonine-protein kinase
MSGIPAGAGQLLGKRLGKFEILALLALGGTAEIYLARIGGAAGFEKYVVVKCLHDHLADDPEFVKMFLDEARLAAHLDHSNIVQTMELGQHEGRYYMVMEFLAGLSLAMIVRRATERLPNNRIPLTLVLNILAQSCAGLHYAHEKAMNGKALNIVHRDISPQNLVISFEGVVKVVDFGIAKAELRETRTRSGTIKGKFAYMSPEQCVANNVDRRTDVFALGVIAHELLTGRRLFKRPSPYETYQAVIECDVKPPSTLDASIDPSVDPVIMRAVAKNKEDRYPTAEAFGDALLSHLHHRGIGSGPGDVSRFFDASFAQEIDEHSGRMRELISGRDVSVETGVNWRGDEAEDAAKHADDVEREDAAKHEAEAAQRKAAQRKETTAAKPHRKPTSAGTPPRGLGAGPAGQAGQASQANKIEPQRPSGGSLSMLIDDLGGGSRVEDDDEMPAERTRIESNPLGRISELDRGASRTPGPQPVVSAPPISGAVALPAPPPGPAAAAKPSGMPPSGRFPDLANLPTMIADPDPEPDAAGGPAAGAGRADALPPELARTQIAPPLSMGLSGPPSPSGPSGPPGPLAHGAANGASPYLAASGPPMQPPQQAPQGYPVMSSQLSAQIATGASVFPSEHRGGPPHPSAPPSGPPVAPYSVPSSPPHGAPAFHGGPSPGQGPGPGPGGLADGYPQMAPPRMADGGPGQPFPRDGNFMDPGRAGNMMSPVGQQYPEHVDWGAAAAARARAVPPWLLAVLFVGAIGIALTLTIVIARIIR